MAAMRRGSDGGAEYKKIVLVSQLNDRMSGEPLDQV